MRCDINRHPFKELAEHVWVMTSPISDSWFGFLTMAYEKPATGYDSVSAQFQATLSLFAL